MPGNFPQRSSLKEPSRSKAVAIWLMIGVAMLIIQVLLGGITRLTGSGLSITEWDVITGALPPMNEQKWMEEFSKYKQTPQFSILNSDFTLQNLGSNVFISTKSLMISKNDVIPIDPTKFNCPRSKTTFAPLSFVMQWSLNGVIVSKLI